MASVLVFLAGSAPGASQALVVLAIAVVLVAPSLACEPAGRMGQPAGLGQLVAGGLVGRQVLLQMDRPALQCVAGFLEQIRNPRSLDRGDSAGGSA